MITTHLDQTKITVYRLTGTLAWYSQWYPRNGGCAEPALFRYFVIYKIPEKGAFGACAIARVPLRVPGEGTSELVHREAD